MEVEKFLSGYCRSIDQSRMVSVVVEDGEIAEIDCLYPDCVHRPNCLIAKEIDSLTEA
jgi:hypothetical protein